MSYIWNNPDWPSYIYDAEKVRIHHEDYELQKTIALSKNDPPLLR